MSDIPSLEILSNVNAKYNSATFKTATFESATINDITLPGDKSVVVNNAAWHEVKTDIANSVSKTNTDLQTIAGTIQVTGGVNADIFRSKTGNSITAFTYVSDQGFEYSNVYQMKPYGKTDAFFTISNGNTTLSATEVKGTRLYENGSDISTVYLKKGAIPADVYSKEEIDKKLSDIGDGIDAKQDTLVPGTNLIEGDNVTITKDASGKITISSSGGGTADAYTKQETNDLLAKKQNLLTAGTNISISTSGTTTTINTKDIYTSDQVDTELAKKANKATTLAGYGITDAYTSDAADAALAKKANKATTLAGYGITDAYTSDAADAALAKKADSATVTTELAKKQDTLVPGTNLIEGDNVTITKDTTSGKITISALADLTDILNRISALEKQLGGYTLKSVTQSEYDSLTTKDANTLYLIKAS